MLSTDKETVDRGLCKLCTAPCAGNYIHIGTIIRTYCHLPILFQNLSLYNINNQLAQVNVR